MSGLTCSAVLYLRNGREQERESLSLYKWELFEMFFSVLLYLVIWDLLNSICSLVRYSNRDQLT